MCLRGTEWQNFRNGSNLHSKWIFLLDNLTFSKCKLLPSGWTAKATKTLKLKLFPTTATLQKVHKVKPQTIWKLIKNCSRFKICKSLRNDFGMSGCLSFYWHSDRMKTHTPNHEHKSFEDTFQVFSKLQKDSP